MKKTPSLFTPIATTAELEDRTSWVNSGYQWNQEWQDTICQRLGETVASWSLIESQLFRLYQQAINSRDTRSASWAWESIHSAGALIDLTDAALCGMQKRSIDQAEWHGLLKRVKRQVTKRNRIAHCQIFYDHNASSESKKMFVTSPSKAVGISKRLYAPDLDVLRDGFMDTSAALRAFGEKVFT